MSAIVVSQLRIVDAAVAIVYCLGEQTREVIQKNDVIFVLSVIDQHHAEIMTCKGKRLAYNMVHWTSSLDEAI